MISQRPAETGISGKMPQLYRRGGGRLARPLFDGFFTTFLFYFFLPRQQNEAG
jgi:hypothetical protein